MSSEQMRAIARAWKKARQGHEYWNTHLKIFLDGALATARANDGEMVQELEEWVEEFHLDPSMVVTRFLDLAAAPSPTLKRLRERRASYTLTDETLDLTVKLCQRGVLDRNGDNLQLSDKLHLYPTISPPGTVVTILERQGRFSWSASVIAQDSLERAEEALAEWLDAH